MITTAIINALLSALDAIFSLLPSWSMTLPANDGVFQVVASLNNIIPIGTMGIQLGLFVGLLLSLHLWEFSVYVWHQFHGSD